MKLPGAAILVSRGGRLWSVNYVTGKVGKDIDKLPVKGEIAVYGPCVVSPDGKTFATGIQGERIETYGVRVYEWQPTTLHAKTFVVDGIWSTVGSMNFDNRSMALNDEANLMVFDARVGDEMNRIYLEDLQQARQITLDAFRRRSWLQRVGERCANWLTRLL